MPDLIKAIKTIEMASESEFREKGSIFKGLVFPVNDEEEIDNLLKELRKKYYTASHHCFAYRLKKDLFRYSDDGEPNGTAGIRILNGIDHYGLTDILCVVIRWFGGTKLGVGPLGKAYYKAAGYVLDNSSQIEKFPYYKYFITVPYDLISLFYHQVEKFKVKIIKTEYSAAPKFEILTPADTKDIFLASLTESSNSLINIPENEGIFFL
jgi:uncharacterized YigZ family protein